MAELVNQGLGSLDAGKSEGANLVGIKTSPALSTNALGKAHDMLRVRKVDKCISNVATIAKIHAQVEEIKTSAMSFIDHVQDHLLQNLEIYKFSLDILPEYTCWECYESCKWSSFPSHFQFSINQFQN